VAVFGAATAPENRRRDVAGLGSVHSQGEGVATAAVHGMPPAQMSRPPRRSAPARHPCRHLERTRRKALSALSCQHVALARGVQQQAAPRKHFASRPTQKPSRCFRPCHSPPPREFDDQSVAGLPRPAQLLPPKLLLAAIRRRSSGCGPAAKDHAGRAEGRHLARSGEDRSGHRLEKAVSPHTPSPTGPTAAATAAPPRCGTIPGRTGKRSQGFSDR